MARTTHGLEDDAAVSAEKKGGAATTNWKTSGFARALFRGGGTLHRGLYRMTGGKIGGSIQGVPVALLTTRGRKSGKLYTWPVGYVADGDGFLLAGTAGASPRNPGWYYNLCANPEVSIEIGKQTSTMIATPQTGAARDAYWARILERYPVFASYERKVTRRIPVVVLRPTS